ncbi:hypothetical protein LIER_35774 [Lithospermum erythrorhizon]|uniref:Uncharacterized protein n=1 Tax=Lithospermum erythrorhizon TaxID=34254 RepID=A0AAV3P0T6_LITER
MTLLELIWYPELIDLGEDMKLNTQKKPGVSTRSQCAHVSLDERGAQAVPKKEPKKTTKPPRIAPTQPAMTHSDGPLPSPGFLDPGNIVRQDKEEVPHRVGPRQNPPHEGCYECECHCQFWCEAFVFS